MIPAARRAHYSGPAVLSSGFRPFFLMAAAWPALSAPLWGLVFLGLVHGPLGLDRTWHAHEMLFGYLAAVMAGFLLTAVPNWTGRLPVVGAPLGLLAGLWAAGRIAMLIAPHAPIALVVDCAFGPVFALVVGREVIKGRNWRNLPVLGLLCVFALGHVGAHLAPVDQTYLPIAERCALGVGLMMVLLIGGRITPSFTFNWLHQKGVKTLPVMENRFDRIGLGLAAAALIAFILAPSSAISGLVLFMAGLVNAARLTRWRGARTLSEGLVFILHLGFGWAVLGLFAASAAALFPATAPLSAAAHAIGAGAFGVMSLGVMTRVTLGHTGRERTADGWTVLLYACVNLAAVFRVAAALAPGASAGLIPAAGGLWTLAFVIFLVRYGPMLVRPRPDGVRPRAAVRRTRPA
jgi:uncharacterized protein involved in response to NO